MLATVAISQELSLERVLQIIVDSVRPLVAARYAALAIPDDRGVVARFITSGISDEQRRAIGHPPRGHGLLGRVIREDRVIRVADISRSPDRVGFPPAHPPMRTFLGVPVHVEGRVIGNLYLTDKEAGEPFSEDDERLVELFARHAGLAIHNARMHEELRQLAVLQERERIAQDLHDGSIQSLYAVSLVLEDTEELMASDPALATERIDHAIETIHGTIQEIRDFIMGLDPDARRAVDLLAGLTALADEFERSTPIEVDLVQRPRRAPRPGRDDPAHPADPRGHEQRGAPCRGHQDQRQGRRSSRHAAPVYHRRRPRLRHRRRSAAGSPRPHQHACARRVARRRVDHRQQPRGHTSGLRDAAGRARPHQGVEPMTDPTEPRAIPRHSGEHAPPGKALRLLVVDDHEVVRQGLAALLNRREAFQVVAEAGTVEEALLAVDRFAPDLVIMDVRLPDGSGIEACREIRAEHPNVRVVMLTSYPDEEAVLSAIVAGASGYLLKQVRARDLISALEAVGRGESLLDPAVTEKVLERVRRIATSAYTDEFAQLTAQEQKILLLVAEGKTNKEIAAEVFLSDKTVKNYVSSILSKLNLQRRAQAAAYVAKHKPGSSF